MILSSRKYRRFGSYGSGALGDRAWLLGLKRGVGNFLLFGLLFNRHGGAAGLSVCLGRLPSLDALPNQFRNRSVDGAGVCLFLSDTELGEHLEDDMRWNLELPRQLVDADFTHKSCERASSAVLTDLLRVLYGIKFGSRFRRIGRIGRRTLAVRCSGLVGGFRQLPGLYLPAARQVFRYFRDGRLDGR
jgi:hypothetical protein